MSDPSLTSDKQMEVQRHGTMYLLSSAGITAVGFLATMFYAHWVGPEILGQYTLFLSCFSLLSLITDLGIGLAGVKRMCEGIDPDAYYSASISLRIGIFGLLALMFILFHNSPVFISIFGGLEGTGLFWLLLITLGIATFQSSISMALGPSNRLGLAATTSFLDNLTRIIVQVISVFLGYQVYGLIGGLIAGLLIEIVIYSRYIDYHLKKFNWFHVKNIFSFSTWTFLSTVCTVLFDSLNPLIIAMFLPVSEVGIYGVCWTFSIFALFVSTALCSTLFIKVSRWYAHGETDAIILALSRATTYSMIFALPIFVGSFFFSRDLLYYLYGASFSTGAMVLIIIIGTRVIQSILQLYTYFLLAIDHARIAFVSSVVGTAANIVISVSLIPQIGLIGAAIGSLANVLISCTICLYYIRGFIPIIVERTSILHILEATIGMACALELISFLPIGKSAIITVFLVIMGAIIYFGLLLKLDLSLKEDAARTFKIKWLQ